MLRSIKKLAWPGEAQASKGFIDMNTITLQPATGNLSPDFSLATAHIAALTSADPNAAIVDFRCIHDAMKDVPAHSFRGTLQQYWNTLCDYNSRGYGIFLNVNELDGHGRDLINVLRIRAHVVDLDNLVTAEANYQLASAFNPPPAFAVGTSKGKYHCYWPVEPYSDNDRYSTIQRKLRQLFDGDKSIVDASRVLRLAGFFHLKQPDQPHLVRVWSLPGAGKRLPVTALETALAGVNVVEGSGGRHALGDTSLAAPSLAMAEIALGMIEPGELDRAAWLSATAAFKQAGWSLADEATLRTIWDRWCARYEANDAGENDKLWASIRDSEVGWHSLHHRAFGAPPAPDPVKLFGGRQPPLPPGATLSVAGNLLTSLSDAMSRPPTSARWLVKGVLPGNAAGIMFGQPGAGKSFVAIDWSACIASGTAFDGRKVRDGRVVYIAGEAQRGVVDRFTAWFRMHPDATGQDQIHVSDRALSFVGGDDLTTLIAEMDALPTRPALIVVDTLFRATAGADVNDAREMNLFWQAVEILKARYGATVLVVHHSGRNEMQRSFGSIVLLANIDFEMAVIAEGDGTKRIENTKQKDAPEFAPIAFKLKQIFLRHEVDPDDGEIETITSCTVEIVEQSESDRKRDSETRKNVKRMMPIGPNTAAQRMVGGLIARIHDEAIKRRGIAQSETVHPEIRIVRDMLRQQFGFFETDRHKLRNGIDGLAAPKGNGAEAWITVHDDRSISRKAKLLIWARDEFYGDFDSLQISDEDANCCFPSA